MRDAGAKHVPTHVGKAAVTLKRRSGYEVGTSTNVKKARTDDIDDNPEMMMQLDLARSKKMD